LVDMHQLIEQGLSLVESDPRHDLRLGFRCRLWRFLDELGGTPEIARRRRVKLALLTIGKVLPLWEAEFPSDRTPHEALDVAAKVLGGEVSPAKATKEMGRLWTHCDNMLWKHEAKQNVIMVGHGAIQAISEATSDKHRGCEAVGDQSTDFDIEPYDSDAPFFAAAAYAGGAPWEIGSDSQRRLEFWKWWLTTAAAAAPSSDV
jgi:hypothetical protein